MGFSILILCSDGAHHGYLVRSLSRRFTVDQVFCEPEAAQRSKILQRGRYKDYFWRIYHGWRRQFLGLDRYRRAFFGGSFSTLVGDMTKVEMVDDINNPRVASYVADHQPSAIVIMGTSILKGPLLAVGTIIVNIHGGYLPDYRGNHCIFFAYYENRLDKVGATIHLVDAGIDSGAIIDRLTVPVAADDVPESSYCKAERLAIIRLGDLLDDLRQGKVLMPQRQPPTGRTYRTRDRTPLHDLLLWKRIGRLLPVFPRKSNSCLDGGR